MSAEATPETKFTISVQLDGFPVNVEFLGNGKRLKEVIAGLKSAGAIPPPARSFGGGFGGKKDTTIAAAFDDHGNEVCPIHRTRVREYQTKSGGTLKGCPSKSTGAPGETINERGYCSLHFK